MRISEKTVLQKRRAERTAINVRHERRARSDSRGGLSCFARNVGLTAISGAGISMTYSVFHMAPGAGRMYDPPFVSDR